MNWKRHYDFYIFTTDLRPFVRVKYKGDKEWSDYWLHNEENCGCNDKEWIDEAVAIKKVSLWEKTRFREGYDVYFWSVFCFILGCILTYLFMK